MLIPQPNGEPPDVDLLKTACAIRIPAPIALLAWAFLILFILEYLGPLIDLYHFHGSIPASQPLIPLCTHSI